MMTCAEGKGTFGGNQVKQMYVKGGVERAAYFGFLENPDGMKE